MLAGIKKGTKIVFWGEKFQYYSICSISIVTFTDILFVSLASLFWVPFTSEFFNIQALGGKWGIGYQCSGLLLELILPRCRTSVKPGTGILIHVNKFTNLALNTFCSKTLTILNPKFLVAITPNGSLTQCWWPFYTGSTTTPSDANNSPTRNGSGPEDSTPPQPPPLLAVSTGPGRRAPQPPPQDSVRAMLRDMFGVNVRTNTFDFTNTLLQFLLKYTQSDRVLMAPAASISMKLMDSAQWEASKFCRIIKFQPYSI